MKKGKLLPRLALKGIISNGMVYYPYLFVSIVAAFTYFIFSSILQNDLTKILPRRAYAWVMLELGRWLLGIILFAFLIYAGSFALKRRKKEFGLYSLLGLEKKHIGIMLLWENLMLYAVVMAAGTLSGTVLAKLFFLLLLKVSHIPVDVKFTFSIVAVRETFVHFAVIFLANYIRQLWEIGKSRPVELLAGNKKGEKEPRLLLLWSLAGAAALGAGYYLSIHAQVDSMIFIDFFLAVFFCVAGTYLIFTSGSIFFLKLVRKEEKIYYRAANFITISGMYYRMKKNAAGLANICVFSTMVLITLICTAVVCLGTETVAAYNFPYDIVAVFDEKSLTDGQVERKLDELEKEYNHSVLRADLFEVMKLSCARIENRFVREDYAKNYRDVYGVNIMMLDDYNKLTGETKELSEQEVFIYATGTDFASPTMEFMGIRADVKEEVPELFPYPKAGQDAFDTGYLLVVRDRAARDKFAGEWAKQNGVEDIDAFLNSASQRLAVLLEGTEAEKQPFVDAIGIWCRSQPGFKVYEDGLDGRAAFRSMYGGLLFLGIIFGIIFFLCLLIIMYYKQISEGYEDRAGFGIMQKVGMSEDEIKRTTHKQILLVFGLPIAGALAHTVAGMFMVRKLLASINFFDTSLLIGSCIGVALVFTLIYGTSYLITAKTYYRIVNQAS